MSRRLLHAITILLCLTGSLFAALAYGEHFNTQPSPCQLNSVWDCGIVNHSPYALLHGIPIALIGVVGYGLLAALVGRRPWTAFLLAAAGLAFSLRYTFIEWRLLQVWCLYCVTSEILIALITALALVSARWRVDPERKGA